MEKKEEEGEEETKRKKERKKERMKREERRPYNSVHETRAGARFRGIVRGMDPLEGES